MTELKKVNSTLYTKYDPEYIIDNYALYLTCFACPEQYDVIYNDYMVGYLRLRHGYFAVHCPDVGGHIVYEASTQGDGIFYAEEREYHLKQAISAIDFYLRTHIRNGALLLASGHYEE
jgi:hypothetical protein